MPGIAGCLRLLSGETISPDFSTDALRHLVREDNYICQVIAAEADGYAVAVGPGLREPVVGAAFDAVAGIRIGFYGEFYLPGLRDLAGNEQAAALIDLYKEHGNGLPRILDGSFVVFVWDRIRRQALLFNDHVGSRPVYYCEQKGRLYFSPEPKGIARLKDVNITLDELALVTFLSFGSPLGDHTFYKQVHALPPGSILRTDLSRVAVEQYYSYSPCSETAKDEGLEAYISGLRQALLESCRKRLHRLHRSVIPISGGYDSRGILACMTELSGKKLTTVSWGTDEDNPSADAFTGRKVAQYFGTDHVFLKRESAAFTSDIVEMVDRIDGLTTDPAEHHHELQIMRAIRDRTGSDYLLRGEEIFGTRAGWFLGSGSSDKEALAMIGIRELADYPNLIKVLRPDLRTDAIDQSRQLLAEIAEECPFRDYTARKDFYYFTQRIFNYLHRTTYYKLTVLDVANPWLDRAILDFYRTVPVKYRVEKILYRRTLEAMFPELMQIPIATETSLERWDEVVATDKTMQQFIVSQLLESHNALHEMLDRAEVERIVRAAIQGHGRPPAKVRYVGMLKDAFARTSPRLYRAVKSRVLERTHLGFIPVHTLTFRLLVLKLWFDTCA